MAAPVKFTIDSEVLKCPVCVEIFKSPRVLPCGHSACLGCLSSLILYTDSTRSKDSFQCPVCRRLTKPRENKLVRQKWASQFPVNAAIVRLLRNASVGSLVDNTLRRAFCEICLKNNTTNQAVEYCNSCLEYHCQFCASQHMVTQETKHHDVTSFPPTANTGSSRQVSPAVTPEIAKQPKAKSPEERPTSQSSKSSGKPVKAYQNTRDDRLIPIPPTGPAKTVTASDIVNVKTVVKLGHFNGRIPGDTEIPEIEGVAFLSNIKVVMSDHANKKIKVFDVSHKTRVELIADITLRADPKAVCRVDGNTVAALTERSGAWHIRLFTIREKIQYFVQKAIEGTPIGLAYLSNTIVFSYKEDCALHMYRLTRSQQTKLGQLKHNYSGNEIFRNPGAMVCSSYENSPVVYVADETEFGITVSAVDIQGSKKTSVFYDYHIPKPKPPERKTNGVPKPGRLTRRLTKRSSRKDDASDTTTELEADKLGKMEGKSDKPKGKTVRRHLTEKSGFKPVSDSPVGTFRRRYKSANASLAEGRPKQGIREQTEVDSNGLQSELGLDLESLSSVNDLNSTWNGTLNLNDTLTSIVSAPLLGTDRKRRLDRLNADGKTTPWTPENQTDPRHLEFAPKPPSESKKPITYKADAVAVDNDGNVYICMSSTNTVYQMTSDGRLKRELLTDKDGLTAPKTLSFSPSNDMFLVTCAKNNKVSMFKLK